ncbi:endonuclease/exonuclease/phosphatase family protein [Arthrobacter monumenti]
MTDTPLLGPCMAPELHLMTFNIRRPMPHLNKRSPDAWTYRQGAVRRLMTAEQPTLLGLQEAMPIQMQFLASVLPSSFDSVGHGRKSDGSGEHCPIFFDSNRLELLRWDQQALSATPKVPGSTSWGNRIPRILVSATFRDLETGHEFVALNTHLDHISLKSRVRSGAAILDDVLAAELPVILVGDFNVDVDSRLHRLLVSSGALSDAWRTAKDRLTAHWGTFPNYRPPRNDAKRIDWILAGSSIATERAGININTYDGVWPSDHAPVQAAVRFRSA